MRLLYATAFLILAVAATSTVAQEASGPVKVEIVRSGSGYQLLRGGKPYEIRGAGMSVDHLDAFVGHGGNAIRNWTTADEPQNIQAFLDRAHEKGVTVMLCLPMQAERWGFDYDDEEAVASQLEAFRGEVLRYRDHPALLAWIIGNELNHGYTNSRVYDAVNDVARMIHELDPNHPTTTTVAGFFEDVVEDIQSRAPELDFISLQAYGMLFAFPELIRKSGFDEPFMVTEWGQAAARILCLLLGTETGTDVDLVRAADRERRRDGGGRRHASHLERDMARQPGAPGPEDHARRQAVVGEYQGQAGQADEGPGRRDGPRR
jgi:hypothetical protein